MGNQEAIERAGETEAPTIAQVMASFRVAPVTQQLSRASPKKCHATGKGLEVAKLGERATAVLHVVYDEHKAYTKPVGSLICELVSESTGEKIDCSVRKIEASGQYEISYQATSRGRHQLHIMLEGEHIIGSPFLVLVKLPLDQISWVNQCRPSLEAVPIVEIGTS